MLLKLKKSKLLQKKLNLFQSRNQNQLQEEVKAEIKQPEPVKEEVKVEIKQPEPVKEEVKVEIKQPEPVKEEVKVEIKQPEPVKEEVKETNRDRKKQLTEEAKADGARK